MRGRYHRTENTINIFKIRSKANRMANSGVELPELARLLGHSDVSMSYRYYNLTKGTIDKARNILNKRAVVNG